MWVATLGHRNIIFDYKRFLKLPMSIQETSREPQEKLDIDRKCDPFAYTHEGTKNSPHETNNNHFSERNTNKISLDMMRLWEIFSQRALFTLKFLFHTTQSQCNLPRPERAKIKAKERKRLQTKLKVSRNFEFYLCFSDKSITCRS